jgi:hypothetical protein
MGLLPAAARRNGAFFRTQRNVACIPEGSLAANQNISMERAGMKILHQFGSLMQIKTLQFCDEIQSEQYE